MKINKIVVTFIFSLMVLLASIPTLFASDVAGSPVNMLQGIANQMIANLEKNKITLKSNPRYVYSLANKLVVPHVDVVEMSRRVLPAHVWDNATPAQRAEFEHQFVDLLVHTYASALASYTDQTVEFYPVRGGHERRTTVEVNSQITSNSGAPAVNVRYRLILKGGQWKLYDMSVEGVSVIESFRSQFADVLSQGNMDVLIQRLSRHNAQ